MHKIRLLSGCCALVALILGAAPAMAQTCAADTDCAAPLVCQAGGSICHQTGSMSADGGMTISDPVCETEPATCTYVLIACQTDSQCTQPGWTCMPLTDAVPATSICFPKGIDCSAGTSCPADWSCLNFATVKNKDMAEMWAATGSTKFCWPDSLMGVPTGTTKVDATKAGVTGVKGGGSESPTIGLGPSADGGRATAGGDQTASTNDTEATDKSSGCTMLGSGSEAGLWLCLAAVLAWRMRRKRTG